MPAREMRAIRSKASTTARSSIEPQTASPGAAYRLPRRRGRTCLQ